MNAIGYGKLMFLVALAVFVSGCVSYDTTPTTTTGQVAQLSVFSDPALGNIIAGPDGRTLYMFTKDTPGVTVCYDQCAVNWPPLITGGAEISAPGITGTFSTVERKDGSLQLAINGMPLYYWIGDTAPGQTNGQNVGGVWFVVYPDGSWTDLSTTTTTIAATTSTTLATSSTATTSSTITTSSTLTSSSVTSSSVTTTTLLGY